MMYENQWAYSNYIQIPIMRYYPCIKYQIPADPEIDGTDNFIVAESMKFDLNDVRLDYEIHECKLSFSCDNGQKAFYKIMKDCFP